MNKRDTKRLESFRIRLSAMRDVLDDMAGAYRDKFDNATEKWQRSDAGEACDTLSENLYQVASDIESAEIALADLVS